MRILFISNVYPTPARPSQGTFNAELIRALQEAGHTTRVLVPVPWTSRLRQWRTRWRQQVEGTSFVTFWFPPRIFRSTYHRWMWWSIRREARSAGGDGWADVVMAFWVHPDGRCAVDLARELGVPSVVIAGGSDLLVVTSDPARKRAVAETLEGADLVLAEGGHLVTRAIELGACASRVHLLRRGVDAVRFSPGSQAGARESLGLDPDQALIIWAGNMVPVKGLELLVRAHACLPEPRPTLALIGDGPARQQLVTLTRHLGTEMQVRLVGRVPHEALGDWYRAADVFALPSRSEGTPNVLQEASACGLPFVACDVGAVADLATASDRVVIGRSPEVFGAAIAGVLASPGERHGKAPRPRGWRQVIAGIEHLLLQTGRIDVRTSP